MISLPGLAVVLAAQAAMPAQGWNPLETLQDAWQRQQSQDYQHRQANPMGLNPRPEPLGDPRIPPPSNFNSMGQPQWNSPGGGQRPADPWRR
jgi:hypothetical protein